LPAPVPGLVAPVPVVGFEIESGWKSRTHVKDALLNLRDAGVALDGTLYAGGGALGLGGADLALTAVPS
jgi:hypothetical protein